MSEDPIFDGINWYIYAENDPVNNIDPSGLRAGKLYATKEQAAIEWAKEYYSVTNYILMERGSVMYSKKHWGKKKYAYVGAITGKPHSVGGRSAGRKVIPRGGKYVAFIHSHPNSKVFSDADKRIAQNENVSAFVVVPGSKKTLVDIKQYGLKGKKWSTSNVKKNVKYKPLSKIEKVFESVFNKKKWNNHLKEGCKFNCKDKKWPNN